MFDFNLTKQEKQIILFLCFIALCGLGINFAGKRFSQIKIIGYTKEIPIKINLKQADKTAMLDIPGIGQVLAQRIISYQKNSGFSELEDLKNVKGIGKAKYEKIKEYFIIK